MRSLVGATAILLAFAAPAAAAPDLTLTASHAKPTFLRNAPPNTSPMSGRLTVTVTNAGADPTDGTAVTVTQALPTGLSALTFNPALGAGATAATGAGWTCSGAATSTCTRNDALAPGASYPPITVTVNIANSAAATLHNAPTVAGGGDGSLFTGSDDIPVAVDACPNGWSPMAHVEFDRVDSGVTNPERADGCTLLDDVFNAEPFADHAAFVAKVREVAASFATLSAADRDAIAAAGGASTVGATPQIDDSCPNRIAFTFDDGPSYYRPINLANLRAKQAPATFFNLAVRSTANPQIDRFALAEGHTLALHTYDHARMTNLSAGGLQFEIENAASLFGAQGTPLSVKVLRAPFGATNATVNAATAGYGFAMDGTSPAGTLDYDPVRTVTQIRDAMVAALRPGGAFILHDGPIDTPAGAATAAAVPLIIDEARARGYCFGGVDQAGRVVADRYVNSGQPIPQIVNPVPYIPLAYPGTPPSPYRIVDQPLKLAASHAPAVFVRGATGTITLTVSNPTTDLPVDTNTVTVTHPIPAGLTSTVASGTGWTCSGTTTITCTRSEVLAPGGSYPPITIGVRVADTAAAVLSTAPRVTGRGGNVWVDQGADRISTAAPVPGDVGGTVPATLALTLGSAPSFRPFTPGLAKEYTATLTASAISSAGDATLFVSDASASAPGRLVNGAFSLASAVRASANGGAAITVSASPATLLSYAAPVANAPIAITFLQAIGANEPLRTGAYAKTFTFTLSTVTP